jgi:hypothetical protein
VLSAQPAGVQTNLLAIYRCVLANAAGEHQRIEATHCSYERTKVRACRHRRRASSRSWTTRGSPRFSSSVGYLIVNLQNSDAEKPSHFHQGHYALANLFYHPIPSVRIAGLRVWLDAPESRLIFPIESGIEQLGRGGRRLRKIRFAEKKGHYEIASHGNQYINAGMCRHGSCTAKRKIAPAPFDR